MKETNEVKKKKGRLVLAFFSVFGIIVLLLLAISVGFNHTFSWFAANREVSGEGMQVVVDGDLFELHVQGSQIVPGDETPPFPAVINHFVDFVLGREVNSVYTRVNDTDPSIPHIYCNMIVESENGSQEIAPGSYGTISFDIKPKTEGTFNISLSKIGLKHNQQTDEITVVNNQSTGTDLATYELIQGHILIFQDRDANGYYSNLVQDTFTIDTSDPSLVREGSDNEYIKVTLYWIWAHSFSHLYDYKWYSTSIFSALNTSELTDLRNDIKSDVQNITTTTNSNFFIWHEPVVFGTIDNSFYETYYVQLSDGYNNGDQLMGDTFRYIAVEISVEFVNNT